MVLQEGEIRHVPILINTILYVYFRNSREGKSTLGVGNPCAPHPLNKSLPAVEPPALSFMMVSECYLMHVINALQSVAEIQSLTCFCLLSLKCIC